MGKVRERKRKSSGRSVSALWGPRPKIERLKVSIFKGWPKMEIVSILRDGGSRIRV